MKHGSLFSGIGGFDLAAEWMGWENVFHCEWMEFPRKVLNYHFPNADSHIDICKTNFTKYANKIDILTGGFPCQPFSTAGKRKGKEDERYLWGEMLRAIQEIKPQFVVAENVFGITNIDEGLVFQQVCLDLETEGYEVQPFVIPACAKNAPHRRDRCWFIAYAKNGRCGRWLCERCANGEWELLQDKQRGCEVGREIEGCCRVGYASNTNSNGLNKGRGYDFIGKNVDGSNTSVKWSTDSKDINGCGANGILEEQSRIGSRVSKQANVKKNQTTISRRVCGVDETNKCKGTIRKNWIIIDKSRALVQERQGRFFASVNRGLGNDKTSLGQLANLGLSIDLSRVNSMDGYAANTDSRGLERTIEVRRDSVNVKRESKFGFIADTTSPGRGENNGQGKSRFNDQKSSTNDWDNFPTQSPICSGDDGFSDKLDGITFSNWRKESIKAYGNAIVPQVAYEIFSAIEKSLYL